SSKKSEEFSGGDEKKPSIPGHGVSLFAPSLSLIPRASAMISYPRSENASAPLNVRIIGLGNAGVHLADRLAMAGGGEADIIVMNTDAQSLASSIAPQKIALGQTVTRGLGAGGDPEVGYQAAMESRDEIARAVEGAQLLFLCAGLGGGTA